MRRAAILAGRLLEADPKELLRQWLGRGPSQTFTLPDGQKMKVRIALPGDYDYQAFYRHEGEPLVTLYPEDGQPASYLLSHAMLDASLVPEEVKAWIKSAYPGYAETVRRGHFRWLELLMGREAAEEQMLTFDYH